MCDNICIYLRYDVIQNYATAMKVETYPNKKRTGIKSKIEIKMERQNLKQQLSLSGNERCCLKYIVGIQQVFTPS